MSTGTGGREYSVESMILEQLTRLTEVSAAQGRSLTAIEVHQSHQANELKKIGQDVEEIAKNELHCPARNGYSAVKARLGMLEDKSSKKYPSDPPPKGSKAPKKITWGSLPLPVPQDLAKLIPWIVAIAAGIAAGMGWIPPGGNP